MMENTGRLRQPLDRRARDILFEGTADRAIEEELPFYVQIDRAHLVMLVEQGIVTHDCARRLLAAIDDLVAREYAPLRGRPMSRGAYLWYEHWLIETLGDRVGGMVHLGRSRNDINATMLRLRMRPVYRRLTSELRHLVGALIRRAERHVALTMPVYTHYQAALPITYGHYLAGIAQALMRDLQGIEDAARQLDVCPLGAGAAAGTAVPIDCARTAALLGFADAVHHSLDAVASRDLVLRLLAAASIAGITLSRLATDLQLWSTAEFDFIRFPDTLVGSSSMMPQKRNAFLLEHIKGRSGAPLGAFTAAAMAMHATPFSNSVAVGTEGVTPFWRAMTGLMQAIVLMRLVVAGAEPQPYGMYARAVQGFTSATELANRLVLQTGMSFRQAHHCVGAAVREASEQNESFAVAAGSLVERHGLAGDVAWLDPAAVAAQSAAGGGPAERGVRRVLADVRNRSAEMVRALRERSRRWTLGARALDEAVAALMRATSSSEERPRWVSYS